MNRNSSQHSSLRREWTNTGHTVKVESDSISRMPDYDITKGEHYWIMITVYNIDPSLMNDPTHTPHLDHENLVSVTGPGCYHCEKTYSPQLAAKRCQGTVLQGRRA